MMTLTAVPLQTEAQQDESRYEVQSRMEMLDILRQLHGNHALITAYYNANNDFLLTTILAVDAEAGCLLLDTDRNPALNKRLLEASGQSIIYTASQNRIKIKFGSNRIALVTHQGREAFSIPLPVSMLRLQRREYYRVATPVLKPIKCTIPLLSDDGSAPPQTAEMIVLDLSGGGIALIDQHHSLDLNPGALFENCRIVLPGVGDINAALRVRNSFEVRLRNGVTCTRCGCEFVNLSGTVQGMIQRYITRLEQSGNARLMGFA